MALNSNILVFSFTMFSLFSGLLSFTPNVIVATDGSGNFDTISEAITNIPINRDYTFVILIKEGTYNEAIYIGQNKSNLILLGEGIHKTVIQFNKSNKTGFSTQGSATVGKVLFSYYFF